MQESVKQDRDRYIGGSDIPVIMNLSPFKSRYDLLLEKAGFKTDDFGGNVFTEYGNELEPKIRDYINEDLDNKFTEGKHTREAVGDEIIGVRIHTDGERLNDNEYEVLEIKTTSRISDSIEGYRIYLVQLLYYMVNLGAKYGLLAVYDRPDDMSSDFDPDRLQLFSIDIGDYTELIEEIGEALERFIEDLAKVKDNPFITEEDLLPAEIPEITKEILAFESQLAYMNKIEAKIKREKARLKRAMESAGVKSWETPNGYKITLVEDKEDTIEVVESFDMEEFKKAYAGLYEKFLNKETKVKKGKAGYVKITAPKKEDKQ